MAVELKFKYVQLLSINEEWKEIDELKPNDAAQKAMISAIQDLSVKFQRKGITLMYKYDATVLYKITLKDHEAYFLEMFWRHLLKFKDLGYERNLLYTMANFINQKLA